MRCWRVPSAFCSMCVKGKARVHVMFVWYMHCSTFSGAALPCKKTTYMCAYLSMLLSSPVKASFANRTYGNRPLPCFRQFASAHFPTLQAVPGAKREQMCHLTCGPATTLCAFSCRGMTATAVDIVAALLELQALCPERIRPDIVAPPAPGEFGLLHAAARSRCLGMVLLLLRARTVLGPHAGIAMKGG